MSEGEPTRKRQRRPKSSVAYDNLDFIKLLTKYKNNPKQFKKLINACTNKEINAITEIILNVLKGNLQCNKEKLKKHVSFLRLVGNKKNSFKKRRKAILSKGSGVLAPLLSIALPAIIGMFAR